ncbi:ATXN2_2L [Mytilus coruscus]|uniref:ATXN2_2L n=1 Tax=Mytilus coruscus TaxID=42192 RepID=A0A6J8CWG2_MYTCO|nr:ATXN2_2L [Mytilus coruscus]
MMNSQKRNRTHRPNTNTGNRVTKARGSFDKNVISEGIFTNPRFTYIATSLVGCCVQLQVKNGKCYEGILKTCSPKMDVVLEMAHKVDDTGNNNIPSRELVQEKIIFNCVDILMITAVDVDLDYAVKDTFTDTAITKQNGVADKELRELTPWEPEESETQGGGGLHEGGGASNGWDADDMFSTNERQFNVKSTYDDSLHQYTVPLEKRDTKEYREKEERAALLAQEIEKSDGYRQRTDLENNGEGDNEESKFSAVVRPDNAGPNPGKYVPPGKRNQYNQQRNLRHGAPPNRLPVHQPPPQPTAPRLAAQHSREDYKVNGNVLPPKLRSDGKADEVQSFPPKLISDGKTDEVQSFPPKLISDGKADEVHSFPPKLISDGKADEVQSFPPKLISDGKADEVQSFPPKLISDGKADEVQSFPPKLISDGKADEVQSFPPKLISDGKADEVQSFPPKLISDGKADKVQSFPPKLIFDGKADEVHSFPPKLISDGKADEVQSFPPKLISDGKADEVQSFPPKLISDGKADEVQSFPPKLISDGKADEVQSFPPKLISDGKADKVQSFPPKLISDGKADEVQSFPPKLISDDVKEEVKVEEKDNTSPVPDSAGPTESIHTSPVSKIDKKNSTPKAQNALIQDLKDFSVNFKLSEDSKETKKSPEKVEKTEQKEELEEKTKSPPPPVPTTSAALPVVVPATTLDPPQSKEEPKPETNDILKNSSLNPHAKSFVLNPNAKSFQPKQYPQQVPTPPRPQTQSPIIQPMPPAMFQPVIFQTQLGQQMQQQQRPQPKRAVVSIHPPRTDFTAAAAQAATGAPLLAHTNYSAVQYTPFMMPQPASYQVGQVMPMPSATPAAGPRMMTPPSGATMDMSQQPSGHTMFTVGQHGPMPAHIQHQPYHNPQPAHIGPHPGQQNQQNHPAPSPVQHVVTSSQSHPPTSTPQPHNPYQQMSIQGHPPLQPSPHNPASPQTVHMPAVQYQFPLQMQGANNQVMSQTHPPTSVPHSIHSHMQPQFVMMPHPHNQHNQQNQQFPAHHLGQTPMVHQAGVPTLQNTQPGTHPQFIPQGLTFNRL